MTSEDRMLMDIGSKADKRLLIWQAIAAGLAVLWLMTFAWWSFRAELSQGQWLTMFRDQLVQSVQALAQQQQSLESRLKALEGRKGE